MGRRLKPVLADVIKRWGSHVWFMHEGRRYLARISDAPRPWWDRFLRRFTGRPWAPEPLWDELHRQEFSRQWDRFMSLGTLPWPFPKCIHGAPAEEACKNCDRWELRNPEKYKDLLK